MASPHKKLLRSIWCVSFPTPSKSSIMKSTSSRIARNFLFQRIQLSRSCQCSALRTSKFCPLPATISREFRTWRMLPPHLSSSGSLTTSSRDLITWHPCRNFTLSTSPTTSWETGKKLPNAPSLLTSRMSSSSATQSTPLQPNRRTGLWSAVKFQTLNPSTARWFQLLPAPKLNNLTEHMPTHLKKKFSTTSLSIQLLNWW